MCSSCGFPAAPGHWTEAGETDGPDRLRARFRRAEVLDGVLMPYGLRAFEGTHVVGIQLSNQFGSHSIVRNLAEVWPEAERMLGRAVDPLDARFTGRTD